MLLEERVSGCDWYAVVTTFDDEIDLRKEALHTLKSGGMVA